MAEQQRPFSILGAVALLVLGGVIVVGIQALVGQRPSGAGAAPAPIPASLASFHDAVSKGDLDSIKRSAAGVDINAPFLDEASAKSGMTPLMLAATDGNAATVKVLLELKAKPDIRTTPDGRTALMLAAAFGDSAKVRALLEAGAQANARAQDGWTPLMFAAARGEAASVKALLDAGADVNALNKWRQTALMQAARTGSPEKIAALLEAGASASIADQDSATALTIAAESNEAGTAVLEALIKAGAPVDAGDRDGVTALMKSADAGDIEKVKTLLENGASKEVKDRSNKWTAKDWAAKRDDEKGRAIVAILEGK